MGKRFGQWEIVEGLGEGGQSWIYRVRNVSTGQTGALKRLKNTARHARFVRELEALDKIPHENVVRVLDSNVETDVPFIVLEHVDGRSLGDISPEELDRTPIRVRMDWYLQVCRGLAAAHRKDVLHRDLKPDNILIATDGRVKICDFGLAFVDDSQRLTETLEQVGSRFYMAPECEEGRTDLIGKATDLYSLGKVLYHLLSGARVFPRELHRTPRYDLATIRSDPFMEAFSRILDSMIVHDPKQRAEEVDAMAKKVTDAVTAYEGRFPIAGAKDTYKCVFCRVGLYEQVLPKPGANAHNLGYSDEGRVSNEHFVFLECQNCGNSQRFKVKYDRTGWFERE